MSINTIGASIVTLLTPLLNAGKIKQLDQYSSREVLGYPRIQVLSKGVETEYLTNVERLKTYNFDIVITQEKTVENITPEDAEEISDLLIQEVVDLLDGQINTSTPLAGAVDFIRPVSTSEIEALEELPVISNTIQLQAIKMV
jgi:hypothetical protein